MARRHRVGLRLSESECGRRASSAHCTVRARLGVAHVRETFLPRESSGPGSVAGIWRADDV
ncbi:hypothetical protein C8T65DRAFT_677071, partial [Cerioporus squamosus]